MSCNNSLCLDQLLEPDPDDDFIILNSNGSPSLIESGAVSIPLNATEVSVSFVTPKSSVDFIFNELLVENLVDQSPLAIIAVPSSRQLGGFTVLLNAKPDSVNYRLRWSVAVQGL